MTQLTPQEKMSDLSLGNSFQSLLLHKCVSWKIRIYTTQSSARLWVFTVMIHVVVFG